MGEGVRPQWQGVRELLDEVAVVHGGRPASVTFLDPGTVLETLEEAGFAVPDGAVVAEAQRRAFDRGELVDFLRTQAAMAYLGDLEPHRREPFVADAVGRVDGLRDRAGTFDQTFVRLHVLCQAR
jgi:hypothetical protein